MNFLLSYSATVTNTTYEETDPMEKYTGTWDNNTSPYFSGGGSAFTNEDGASVTLTFHGRASYLFFDPRLTLLPGSAIYVFGDKKNDHGLYNVTIDSNPPEIFDGVSGCGGSFGKTCEQIRPGLDYFASNLGQESYTIIIRNIA